MSLERSKFYAGTRSYETNAYLGTMALGAGEGATIAAAARARYNALARQQCEALKRRGGGGSGGVGGTAVCLADPLKKTTVAGAGATKKPLAGTATGRATSSIKRATKSTTGLTAPKRAIATTTLNRHKCPADRARQQQLNSELEGSMPGKRTAAGGKKHTSRANRAAGSRSGTTVTKWLLLPQSNFRQSSESSEGGSNQVKTKISCLQTQNLRVKTSWPDVASNKLKQQQPKPNEQQLRTFSVPSQRILLTDQLRQAQVESVLPKAARLQRQPQPQQQQKQQQQQQQIRSKTLLLQADNSNKAAVTPATTICKSQSSENCSNSSDCPTSVASSDIWNIEHSYAKPIVQQSGGNKSVKLTSTVIKILPEMPTPDKPKETAIAIPKAATVVAACKQLFIRHSLQQQQQQEPTQRQPQQRSSKQKEQQQTTQRQLLQRASKQKQHQDKLEQPKQQQQQQQQPKPQQQQQQQQPKQQQQQQQQQPKQQQQKQQLQQQQSNQQPSKQKQQLEKPQQGNQQQIQQQQQQPKPAQLQHQLLPTTTSTMLAPKIVCVDQHKVPKTVEDGIDISYQYFVSKPVARGRKALPVRYLYRPMMRRLNATASATKRGKKSQSESKTDDQLDPSTCTSPGSTDVETESDGESEEQSELTTPSPPPLLIDAKYLPLLKELNRHPMPEDTQRHRFYPELRALQLQLQQQNIQQQQQNLQQQQHNLQQQQQLDQATQAELLLKKQQEEANLQYHQQLLQAEQQQFLGGKEVQRSLMRPTVVDFQPNVTRLDAVGGATICFHAPIRMCAGGATETTTVATKPAIAADVTVADDMLPASCCCCCCSCRKSVTFQLENINNKNNNSANSCSQSPSNSNSNSCSCSSSNNYTGSCSNSLIKTTSSKRKKNKRRHHRN